MREIAEALLDVLKSGRRGALATLIRTTGSTPQEPGARLLLRPDGSQLGTIGGGAIEYAVLEALKRVRDGGAAELLVRDLARDLGMCCGGRMEVFVEPVEGAPRLVLCGAGHVAKPTAALARSVGFEVTVIDEREALNLPERFPGCTLELRDPTELLPKLALSDRDWVLIMTHDHRVDEDALGCALLARPRFVGLIGSRRKVLRLLRRLRAKHGDALPLDRLYAPVGIDIGATSPEEIAVSVVAELVALRRGAAAAHLGLGLDPALELDREAADEQV